MAFSDRKGRLVASLVVSDTIDADEAARLAPLASWMFTRALVRRLNENRVLSSDGFADLCLPFSAFLAS